eukprot:2343912-Pyramimonas_sp.AAC.1
MTWASPQGPSPHGSGTSGASVAAGSPTVLGERPASQNRAVTPNPPRLTTRCGHHIVWGPPDLHAGPFC